MGFRAFITRARTTLVRWQTGVLVGMALLASELGARIGVPGVDGQRVASLFRSLPAGPIRWYDILVGGGLSRAAILALGILPYFQARAYLGLAKLVSGRLGHRGRRVPSRRARLALTTIIAVIQSVGFARFLETAPGAVAEPGIGFVIRTTLWLTGAAVSMGWVTDWLLHPGDAATDPIAVGPPLVAAVSGDRPLLTEGPPVERSHATARDPMTLRDAR